MMQMPFREDSPPRRREAVKAEEAGEEEGCLEGGDGVEAVGIDGCEEEGCLEGGDGVEAVGRDDSEFFTEDVVGGCLADGGACGLESGEDGCEGGEEGCEDGGEEGCEEGGEEGCEGGEECCEEDMGDEELKIALRHSAASVILDELARHIGDGV